MASEYSRDRIEKVARMYRTNKDAAAALSIAPGSFSRLCRQYGVETPQAARRRKQREDFPRL